MAKRKMRNEDILKQIKRYEALVECTSGVKTPANQLSLEYFKGKLEAFKEVYGQDGL